MAALNIDGWLDYVSFGRLGDSGRQLQGLFWKQPIRMFPRLLSSLVRTVQYNECNGMTSFMEFMISRLEMVEFFQRNQLEDGISDENNFTITIRDVQIFTSAFVIQHYLVWQRNCYQIRIVTGYY